MSISFLDLRCHARRAPPGAGSSSGRRVVDGSAFIGGEAVDRFEAEWAAYCGTRHCVGLSDGTAALELALAALGIGPGDEVIVPANTFIATVEAVAAVGAVPVMIDVDPATLLMTGEAVRAACTPRTAAVIAVHLYGQPVDMDAIRAVAEPAGIAVIEDAAQAHGATWRGARAGSLGHVGCFSFYPGKNLGAFGDAGGVVTDDAELAQRIRCLANHGRPRGAAEQHVLMGQNHRLDGLQAAILSVKLRRLDAWNAARRRLAQSLRRGPARAAGRARVDPARGGEQPSPGGGPGPRSATSCAGCSRPKGSPPVSTTPSPVISSPPAAPTRRRHCRWSSARPAGSCRCRCTRIWPIGTSAGSRPPWHEPWTGSSRRPSPASPPDGAGHAQSRLPDGRGRRAAGAGRRRASGGRTGRPLGRFRRRHGGRRPRPDHGLGPGQGGHRLCGRDCAVPPLRRSRRRRSPGDEALRPAGCRGLHGPGAARRRRRSLPGGPRPGRGGAHRARAGCPSPRRPAARGRAAYRGHAGAARLHARRARRSAQCHHRGRPHPSAGEPSSPAWQRPGAAASVSPSAAA